MGHCTPEDLLDVAEVLGELRQMEGPNGGIVEKGHAVFYLMSLPFLRKRLEVTRGRPKKSRVKNIAKKPEKM